VGEEAEEGGVMDWVEDRARRERIVREAAPELWRDLCTAIEEAVKSMQRIYQQGPICPEFNKVHDNSVIVRMLGENGGRSECSFTFEPDSYQITVVGVGGKRSKDRILIEEQDGQASLVIDGKRLTPDQVSRAILEPLFFRQRGVATGFKRGSL
jgi:hypothetical protein